MKFGLRMMVLTNERFDTAFATGKGQVMFYTFENKG